MDHILNIDILSQDISCEVNVLWRNSHFEANFNTHAVQYNTSKFRDLVNLNSRNKIPDESRPILRTMKRGDVGLGNVAGSNVGGSKAEAQGCIVMASQG